MKVKTNVDVGVVDRSKVEEDSVEKELDSVDGSKLEEESEEELELVLGSDDEGEEVNLLEVGGSDCEDEKESETSGTVEELARGRWRASRTEPRFRR
jgi:hypothetical protein